LLLHMQDSLMEGLQTLYQCIQYLSRTRANRHFPTKISVACDRQVSICD
jgi:hypothetical protein